MSDNKNTTKEVDVEVSETSQSPDQRRSGSFKNTLSERKRTISMSIEASVESVKQTKSQFIHHEDEELSSMAQARNYVFGSFVGNLPLPELHFLTIPRLVGFGLVAYCVYVGLFLGFAISGYDQKLKEEFVSLDVNAGICEEVHKPVTGYFLAGSNGKWEGEEGFTYNLAAYEFDFTSLKANVAEFEEEIQQLKENQLTTIGNKQATLGMNYNLLLWMHFSTYFTVNDKVQSFGFSAEPGDVFNREYFDFDMKNKDEICSVDPKMTFDQTYGRMKIEFKFDENDTADKYLNYCKDIVNPHDFGYIADYDDTTFSIEMDLVSLTSALSVNLGMIEKSHFEKSADDFVLGMYNSKSLSLQSLFDPRYPRMQPILCFALSDDNDAYDDDDDYDLGSGATSFVGKCIMRLGGTAIIPAFNHWASKCQQCPESGPGVNEEDCQEIDVVSSFVHFPNGLLKTINLFNKYEDSQAMNDAIYEAYNTNDFSFCDDNCSLISLNSYDELNQAMSPYFYNLNNGHCRDSTDKESFDSLGATPPTDLVEEYYRCRSTKTSAFFDSVGIANGNMLFFAPFICLLFLLPIIRLYHTYVVGEPIYPPGAVTEKAKDAALKELISRLLDVTNGKATGDSNGAVAQLANDLNSIAVRESKMFQEVREKRSDSIMTSNAMNNL